MVPRMTVSGPVNTNLRICFFFVLDIAIMHVSVISSKFAPITMDKCADRIILFWEICLGKEIPALSAVNVLSLQEHIVDPPRTYCGPSNESIPALPFRILIALMALICSVGRIIFTLHFVNFPAPPSGPGTRIYSKAWSSPR
ncbi:hypothetical protein BCR42DRAFT_30664 [Absidia repens]|uniref:Uncharacterized protein n=1 Tax=Absidia repens TaxID=90262 RepID=A0A1X2IJ61_9FUNG|nr:hypothetical protein BCR42DRAFT_30664 [Absidia repens]